MSKHYCLSSVEIKSFNPQIQFLSKLYYIMVDVAIPSNELMFMHLQMKLS